MLVMEMSNQSSTDTTNEFESLKFKLAILEEDSVKKDLKISQLMSRMREYELGDYGLAQAVSEIKDCKKVVRVREKYIEKLTDEVNCLKLKLADQTSSAEEVELSHKTPYENNILYSEISPLLTEITTSPSLQDENSYKFSKDKQVLYLDKSTQCQIYDCSSEYIEKIYESQLQNVKLRQELKEVCENAIHLQKIQSQDKLENENIMQGLKECSGKTTGKVNKDRNLVHMENKESLCTNFDVFFKVVLERIKHEDIEVQEIFHHLSNQIKVLQINQLSFIRRFISLSDNESMLKAENLKLKKALCLCGDANRYRKIEYEVIKVLSSDVLSSRDKLLLQTLNSSELLGKEPLCPKYKVQLMQLNTKLLKEIHLLKNIIEIAHHQTQAVEAICYAQEIELKALREQYIFFQSQSDEKLCLGKMSIKILQLQFELAACIYELKKYKDDNKAIQSWYSTLQNEVTESKSKQAEFYTQAQEKVGLLQNVVKDLSEQYNLALESQ